MGESYIWISKPIVKIIHDSQIEKYGGSFGIRDEGLLDSDLTNPKNVGVYDQSHSITSLA